jgi:hypothetical protein
MSKDSQGISFSGGAQLIYRVELLEVKVEGGRRMPPVFRFDINWAQMKMDLPIIRLLGFAAF